MKITKRKIFIFAIFLTICCAIFVLEVNAVKKQLGIRINTFPQQISYGDILEIVIFVYDTDDEPIEDAKIRIEIDSSDGYFLDTETSLDVGRTNAKGIFRTKWKCLERQYGGRIRDFMVRATKNGYLGRTREGDFKTSNDRE